MTFHVMRKEGRVGKFNIQPDVLRTFPERVLKLIFGDLVIVRAEHIYSRNTIEYVAYSKHFAKTPEIETEREYEFEFEEIWDKANEKIIRYKRKWIMKK